MRSISMIVLFMQCSLAVLAQDAPKAEIFAGYSYGNYELFSAPSFAMAVGGGVDFSIKHNLAWRLQADYLTSSAGLAQNHVRISTGIVWRLGS